MCALGDKYERMLALRHRLGRGAPSPENRALMRTLAADFPGALRELDRLPTEEIERRLAIAREVVVGERDDAPAWLLWTARYHARMREALRDAGAGTSGRRNVRVFAELAAELGVPSDQIWQTLFPASKPPAHRQK